MNYNCNFKEHLFIVYNEYNNQLECSRCCYIEPFLKISLEDFYKIEDFISFCEEKEIKPKRIPIRDICSERCQIQNKIKYVSISVTHLCNLSCFHCCSLTTKQKEEKKVVDLQFDLVKKIKNIEVMGLIGTGEIFCYYEELTKTLNELNNNDVKVINFITNLTLLDKNRIDELKKISDKTKIRYIFSPSIDGISKETYEAIRIGANFEKVIDNLKYIIQVFGNDNVYVNYTLKKPAFKEVKNVHSFFEHIGVPSKSINITPDCFDEEAKKIVKEL